MSNYKRKVRTSFLSILSNTFLIVIKIIAGILTGSISIISEAIHSGMDLLAAMLAFFSIRIASKPADEKHPYGHGKVENVAAVIEGGLIIIAAVLIVNEAVDKLIHAEAVSASYIGVVVMLISAGVNFFISTYMLRVAKEEDSIALEGDALHLKTDVYTSLGVAFGLFLFNITGLTFIDPIVAILVALFILKEGWVLIKNAFNPILDSNLETESLDKIKSVMARYTTDRVSYHALKTRKSGYMKYIEFHLLVPGNMCVKKAHDLSEVIEKDIEAALKNTDVIIHIEPFDE